MFWRAPIYRPSRFREKHADESALRDALATLRRRLPVPRGGWSAVIQHKGPKFIRSGRATIMPPILT